MYHNVLTYIQGIFLHSETTTRMFGLIQLQYNTLKVAIPKNWKIILSEGIDISANFCTN